MLLFLDEARYNYAFTIIPVQDVKATTQLTDVNSLAGLTCLWSNLLLEYQLTAQIIQADHLAYHLADHLADHESILIIKLIMKAC